VNPPARVAPTRPNMMPEISQMIPAPIASDRVAGSPSLIWSRTFTCWLYEMTLPVKTFLMVSRYWS
jgi:hypothetical protein